MRGLKSVTAVNRLLIAVVILGLAVCLLGVRLMDWIQESDRRMQVLEQRAVATQESRR